MSSFNHLNHFHGYVENPWEYEIDYALRSWIGPLILVGVPISGLVSSLITFPPHAVIQDLRRFEVILDDAENNSHFLGLTSQENYYNLTLIYYKTYPPAKSLINLQKLHDSVKVNILDSSTQHLVNMYELHSFINWTLQSYKPTLSQKFSIPCLIYIYAPATIHLEDASFEYSSGLKKSSNISFVLVKNYSHHLSMEDPPLLSYLIKPFYNITIFRDLFSRITAFYRILNSELCLNMYRLEIAH
ncbi:unnamed protein product [Gordionus sp. m RMFG-2023]